MSKIEKIRFCNTCSIEQGKLIELNWVQGIHHRLKRHWVRTGYIMVYKKVTNLVKP